MLTLHCRDWQSLLLFSLLLLLLLPWVLVPHSMPDDTMLSCSCSSS
jgi:hypothetical protein